jgi:7-carboxy-7-deazaguanine synthase
VSTVLRVAEVFSSVQGEGPRTGVPTTFVRFSGCNLRCPGWGVRTQLPDGSSVEGCDSPHAVFPQLFRGRPRLGVDELLARIPARPANVCITGGEPLLQHTAALVELVERLLVDHEVEVFSNGTIPVAPAFPAGARFVFDHKCPGSGEPDAFVWDNLRGRGGDDAVKFVVKDRADFDFALPRIDRIHALGTGVQCWVGPVWGAMDPHELIRWILASDRDVRLNLQTQSLIGADEAERHWLKSV